MAKAYYNENDDQKAAWLRELIRRGIIADGEVDERCIKLVGIEDLKGFAQCHFFAGVGVWSYALRLARWPDDRPCWTGSCPCPSFSSAGKGEGFDDARHLWPDWVRLIRLGKPAVIFGEQADDAIGYGWLDLVQTDLEAQAYAVGKAVLGACSVGGSDIRQRLYWMANSETAERWRTDGATNRGRRTQEAGGSGIAGRMEHAEFTRLERQSRNGHNGNESGRFGAVEARPVAEAGAFSRLADFSSVRAERLPEEGRLHISDANGSGEAGYPDALKGYWRDADWLFCTDGFWRPVESGTFPLAHGDPCRLGRLRGYGDAINAEVAKAFIECGEAVIAERIKAQLEREPGG